MIGVIHALPLRVFIALTGKTLRLPLFIIYLFIYLFVVY